MKNVCIFLSLCLNFICLSQSNCGEISGVVYNADSTETIPFSVVKLKISDSVIVVKSDFGGRYCLTNIMAGIYNLEIESALSGRKIISGVRVDSNQVTVVDVYLQQMIITCCGGFCWPPPHAFRIGEEQIMKIKRPDLKIINTVTKVDMTLDRSSDFQTTDLNQIYARGARDGDVLYLVDGVKTHSKPILPNCSVNEIQYYLGGIPAKYGDAMGGVVIISTRSYFDLYYEWLVNQ